MNPLFQMEFEHFLIKPKEKLGEKTYQERGVCVIPMVTTHASFIILF
jgi:hypothetical protein